MLTVQQILYDFKLPNSATAKLDLEILLAHTLQKPRSFLYAFGDYQLSKEEQDKWQQVFKRRKGGEPISYILETQDFWGISLKVNQHTLIPRPETELLVEKTLQLLANTTNSILELGTGSGAITLALASERPNWSILATDKFTQTLQIAKQNAANLKLQNVQFMLSDWFSDISITKKFNLIISNPPYIAVDDIHLEQLTFEPQTALIAADNGLADLRHIIRTAPDFLADEGYLLLEHGFNQAESVRNLFKQHKFINITTIEDLAGLERITLGQISRNN